MVLATSSLLSHLFLSKMISYDVARTVHRSFLEHNRVLWRGERYPSVASGVNAIL